MELGAAAVERVAHFEVEIDDRGLQEETAADASELFGVQDVLAERRDPTAVHEDVEARAAADAERRGERDAQFRGPDQALIAYERSRGRAAQARAAEQPLVVRRERRRRG